ncbi:hypothetical protein L218DRAFT_668279 [Marasmius fiardii PR-910]|nr:hypothetical protein L218DRAFT_668279 [Marasmius fiardii PR-910]
MSQGQPLSDHISSLTLEPSNSENSELECSTQSPTVMEYASEEENAKFHREFPHVPKEERLVVCEFLLTLELCARYSP